MAGRPVTSRGGLTGAHYGMITFAILTVTSLGLFIFTLTRVKAAEDEAAQAQRRARLHGNPPSYYADEAQARRSNVFAVMAEDLGTMANLVTGEQGDVGATVLEKADRVLAEIADSKPGTINKGDTLITALRRMSELHNEAEAAAGAMEIVVDELQAETGDLTQQLQSKEDAFTAEVESLSKQLQQTQGEMFSALEQKDTQLRDIQATLDAREQQIQKLKREGTIRERDLEGAILGLENQIARLQSDLKAFKLSFDPTAILTKADGRILRAIPGSDLVYVNLGAADHVKPGMGFEVFSQTGDLPGRLSGKASLEIVTVMEDTAECRVMRRTAGQPIIEGDIVVNIAYERGRKPRFVIRGDFDLNYDGEVDWDGLEQVAAIIREWGGQVVDELDETIDFVVIGLPPTIPAFARGEKVSHIVQAEVARKTLEASRFRALVDRAQKMYIPVLTQSPFLYLTGYAGEGAVVRR